MTGTRSGRTSKNRDQQDSPTDDETLNSDQTVVEPQTSTPHPNKPKNKNLKNVSETSTEDFFEDTLTSTSSGASSSTGPKNFKEARKLAKAEKGELFKAFDCLRVGELCMLKDFARLIFTLPDVFSNLLIRGGEEFRRFNDSLQSFSFKLKTIEEMLQATTGKDVEDALAVVEVSLEFLDSWLRRDVQALNKQPGCLPLIILTLERPVYKFLFGKTEAEKLIVRLKSLMKTRPVIANQSAFKILTWNPSKNGNGKKGSKEAGGKADKAGDSKAKKKPY